MVLAEYKSPEEIRQRKEECGIPFWPHAFVKAHCDMEVLLESWNNEYACLGYGERGGRGQIAAGLLQHRGDGARRQYLYQAQEGKHRCPGPDKLHGRDKERLLFVFLEYSLSSSLQDTFHCLHCNQHILAIFYHSHRKNQLKQCMPGNT